MVRHQQIKRLLNWLPRRYVGKSVRIYRWHFALWAFLAISLFQLLSVYLRHNGSSWYVIPFGMVLASCCIYYWRYSSHCLALLRNSRRGEYVFAVYGLWGVVAFTFVFLFLAAQSLQVVHETIFPVVVGSPTYFEFVRFCIYKVVNNLTFDGLQTFGHNGWDLAPKGKDGQWIIYLIGCFFQIVLIATLVQEFLKLCTPISLHLEELAKGEIDPSKITPKLIAHILKEVERGSCTPEFEKSVSLALIALDSSQCRDIYIRLLDSTQTKVVFKRCIDYFSSTARDRRFRGSLEEAISRNPMKRGWAEEFMSRRGERN